MATAPMRNSLNRERHEIAAVDKTLSRTAVPSSAARTPGSSWAATKPPCSASGGRSAARPSRRTCPATSSSSSASRPRTSTAHWYERNTGQARQGRPAPGAGTPVIRWMAATLDGIVEGTGAVFEAKFMLPWSFSEEAAAEKHMAQLQHNMWVTHLRSVGALDHHRRRQVGRDHDPSRSALSAPSCSTAEKKFWRCVADPASRLTSSMPSRRGRASRPSASST